MKVSIITATYNNKETLKLTIDSVLSQDYQNIEYIIIDGGERLLRQKYQVEVELMVRSEALFG